MSDPASASTRAPAEIEEWFMEALEAGSEPAASLVSELKKLGGRDPVRAEGCAELLQDQLGERKDVAPAMHLLALRVGWAPSPPREFRRVCRDAAEAVLNEREASALLKGAGFDDNLPLAESIRRLVVLTSLEPGTMVHDGTWGFGVVSRLDHFYQRAVINFVKKPMHQMSFSYAAETLDLVNDDHLFARRHRDEAGFSQMLKDEQAEVVRIAIRSFGSMSAVRLQDLLVPEFMPESEWKRFWDGARRALKSDPKVDLPTKRTAPIVLLEREKAYDDAWFTALSEERNSKKILELAREFLAERDDDATAPAWLSQLGERLEFAVMGFESRHPESVGSVLLLAREFGLSEEQFNPARGIAALSRAKPFLKATAKAPARELSALVELMGNEAGMELIRDGLNEATLAVLNVLVTWLEDNGHMALWEDVLRISLQRPHPRLQHVVWMASNDSYREAWGLGDNRDLMARIADALEYPATHDGLKSQKALRKLLGSLEWLKQHMDGLSQGNREYVLTRFRQSRGWEESDRRSLLGRLVKLYPDLEAKLVAADKPRGPAKQGRLTSWRSYRERQAQLNKLVEEEIPENSKEIGVARSYGDLRENFEYQAAKDQQKLLLRREADIEADLSAVKGSSFEGLPHERVGIGTQVRLSRGSGSEESYCLLGEWDRDEVHNIISSRSKMAEALMGAAAGADVTIPGEHGEETCRVIEVLPLSDEIVAWISG